MTTWRFWMIYSIVEGVNLSFGIAYHGVPLCIYIAPNCSKAWRVQCCLWYCALLRSLLIRVGHSLDFVLPSVAILSWLCRKRRKAIFTIMVFYTFSCYNPRELFKFKKPWTLLIAKLCDLNFHELERVSRYRDPQIQVDENYSYLFNLRATTCKSWFLNTHLFPNNCDLIG